MPRGLLAAGIRARIDHSTGTQSTLLEQLMDASEFTSAVAVTETAETTALTEREKHLIGLAVTATRGCIACTGGRIEKALATGIEYEAVRASIDLAAAVNAGVTLRTAIEGASRMTSDAACSGAECEVGTN